MLFNFLDMEKFAEYFAQLCVDSQITGSPMPSVQIALQYWYKENKE